MSETIVLPKTTKRRKKKRAEQDLPPKKQPPYNVVLLNDDDHSYEYVIIMLQQLFGHPPEKGYLMAKEDHHLGRRELGAAGVHPLHQRAAGPGQRRGTRLPQCGPAGQRQVPG